MADTLRKSDVKIYVTTLDSEGIPVSWASVSDLVIIALGDYSSLERSISAGTIYTDGNGNFYFWLTQKFIAENKFIQMTGQISQVESELADNSNDEVFDIGGIHEII